MEILRYYYGDDIELVENAPVQSLASPTRAIPCGWAPGTADVVAMKTMLNRISQGYPAIPKLWPVTRTFDEKTQSGGAHLPVGLRSDSGRGGGQSHLVARWSICT